MPSQSQPLIQIDLDQVLASKMGAKARYVPRAVVNWLKRTVCQDQLNEMLRRFYPKTGAEFCEACMADLDVEVDITNSDSLPAEADKRVILVCNHPLGGLDGITLIAALTRRYGEGVRFVVNDLLMAVGPLSNVFLPINKHGKQSREAIEEINRAMEGPNPIVIFPAGLVSRMGADGEIRDLEWHKMFVAKAVQYQRDVVPMYFTGENSRHFYKVAKWRKRLGVNFNVEMLYLPQELLKARGKTFGLTIGHRLPWQRLRDGGDQLVVAQEVKDLTYALRNARCAKSKVKSQKPKVKSQKAEV